VRRAIHASHRVEIAGKAYLRRVRGARIGRVRLGAIPLHHSGAARAAHIPVVAVCSNVRTSLSATMAVAACRRGGWTRWPAVATRLGVFGRSRPRASIRHGRGACLRGGVRERSGRSRGDLATREHGERAQSSEQPSSEKQPDVPCRVQVRRHSRTILAIVRQASARSATWGIIEQWRKIALETH
jgi:hypothetical protein